MMEPSFYHVAYWRDSPRNGAGTVKKAPEYTVISFPERRRDRTGAAAVVSLQKKSFSRIGRGRGPRLVPAGAV